MTAEVIEFFVAPKRQGASTGQGWLIYRRSLMVCVDAATDVDSAIAKCIRLAEFCLLGGHHAQVHLQREKDGEWQTIWSSTYPKRRYPNVSESIDHAARAS